MPYPDLKYRALINLINTKNKYYLLIDTNI